MANVRHDARAMARASHHCSRVHGFERLFDDAVFATKYLGGFHVPVLLKKVQPTS